jgi:hypothetical protein
MHRLTVIFIRNGLISFGLGLLIFSLVSRDDEVQKPEVRSDNSDILKELEDPFPTRHVRRSGHAEDAAPAKTFVAPNAEVPESASAPAKHAAPSKHSAPDEYARSAPIPARDEYPRKPLPDQQKQVPEQLAAQTREVSPKELPVGMPEAATRHMPERSRDVPAEPVSSEEEPQPPLVRSAAVGTYPRPGSGDSDRALEPPPLPEHPTHHLARKGGTPATGAHTPPQGAAQQDSAKPASDGAFSFLADLLQTSGPGPSAWQTARAPSHVIGQAGHSNASAAPGSAPPRQPRKSAVAPWEPAACDKGQRFWER